MYLARQQAGTQVDEILASHCYGIPKYLRGKYPEYPIKGYWAAMMIVPTHPRKDLLLNSPRLTAFLRENRLWGADMGVNVHYRETHFGYRITLPNQERRQLLLEDPRYVIEVHHNGVVIVGGAVTDDMIGFRSPTAGKTRIDEGDLMLLAQRALGLASNLYKFASYGGFCRAVLTLDGVKERSLVQCGQIRHDISPYPFEEQTLGVEIEQPAALLSSADSEAQINLKLRQAFGYETRSEPAKEQVSVENR